MYNFTKLAIELNEEDGSVATTDSRWRPDMRLMEQGNWDASNKVKNQLEDKQRQRRNRFAAEADRAIIDNRPVVEYQPKWFEKIQDPYTGSIIHKLIDNEYWECKNRQDWSRCPNIFIWSLLST